jgi:hypothetical protein
MVLESEMTMLEIYNSVASTITMKHIPIFVADQGVF